MSLSPVNVVIEDPPSRATLESLGRGLDAYNALHSPAHAEEFVVALRADDGALQGGIRAEAWAGMLFVRWVWLQERQRGLGHGRVGGGGRAAPRLHAGVARHIRVPGAAVLREARVRELWRIGLPGRFQTVLPAEGFVGAATA